MTASIGRRPLIALLAAVATAPASWAQSPLLSVEGPSGNDAFGFSVAALGDLNGDGEPDLLVGAPDSDLGGDDSGAAYVLSGADGSVLHTLVGGAPGDDFGFSVADAGDVDGDGIDDLAIGACQATEVLEGWAGDGGGYVQVYSGADGSLIHTWQGESGIDCDYGSFGRTVLGVGDIDGDGRDDVAVAERDGDVESPSFFDPVGGRVWIFSGADGSVLRRLENAGPTHSHLGWGLGQAGDVDQDGTPDLVLGSPIFNNGPFQIVVVSGATALPILQIASSITEQGAYVAGIGDVDDDGVPDLAGAGRSQFAIYSGSTGDALFTSATLPVGTSLPYKGLPLAAMGDLDGDGRGDLAVSCPLGPGSGSLRVFSGATGELIQALMGPQANQGFGTAVADAGDRDGDGKPELFVGSPGFDGESGADSGLATLHRSLISKPLLRVYNPTGFNNEFGKVAACAGDVDNDGHADLVVGMPTDPQVGSSAGRVLVISGLDGSVLHTFLGDEAFDRLGWSVAGASDVDGDGFDDVIAGAPLPTAATGPAYARVWSGRTGALLHEFDGLSNGDHFGWAVGCVGDLDADGRGDLAISAPDDDTFGSNFGAVRLYSGRTGALLRTVGGSQSGAQFGSSLAGAGDVDLDGVVDVIVGARLQNTVNGAASGSASVFSGATGALLLFLPGPGTSDGAGLCVDGLGDVDGDGRPDLGVGAPYADGSAATSGLVSVHSGADGSVLYTLTSAEGLVGQAFASVGDIDGDAVSDIAVGISLGDDGFSDGGAVRVYSGRDGAMLLSHGGPAATDQVGWVVGAAGDIDANGSFDVVTGSVGSALDPAPGGAVELVALAPHETPWESEGHKLPGTHGAPVLAASGSLAPAAPVTLSLSNALQNSTATLVVGAIALNAPFKGGTLVPFPQFLVFGLPTGPAGALILAAPWPGGLPGGVTLHFQYWIVDAAAPAGLAASNAMKGTTP